MPDDLAGNIPLITERVVDALPGFLKELDGVDFTAWKNPKTGRLVCHWNEELVRLIQGLSPEEKLLESFYGENLCFEVSDQGETGWHGTANQLQARLTDQQKDSAHAARSLLSWPGACGTYLSKLADDGTGRVRKLGLTKDTRLQTYWIKAPIKVEECVDPLHHFRKEKKEEGEFNSAEELPTPPHPHHTDPKVGGTVALSIDSKTQILRLSESPASSCIKLPPDPSDAPAINQSNASVEGSTVSTKLN